MENLLLSQELIHTLRQKALQFKMSFLAIFGSYVRGEQTKDSDLDLLVEFREVPSLIGFIQIEKDISKSVGLKIDLVTKDSLNKYLQKQILSEMMVVYDENR